MAFLGMPYCYFLYLIVPFWLSCPAILVIHSYLNFTGHVPDILCPHSFRVISHNGWFMCRATNTCIVAFGHWHDCSSFLATWYYWIITCELEIYNFLLFANHSKLCQSQVTYQVELFAFLLWTLVLSRVPPFRHWNCSRDTLMRLKLYAVCGNVLRSKVILQSFVSAIVGDNPKH